MNDALQLRGELPITALNTIRNDIVSIQSRWHVLVEDIRIGREIRYRYEDPNFSIFNSPLNDEEIEQLRDYINNEQDSIYALAKQVNPMKAFMGDR